MWAWRFRHCVLLHTFLLHDGQCRCTVHPTHHQLQLWHFALEGDCRGPNVTSLHLRTIGAVVALLFIFISDKLVALFVDTASQAGHFDHLDDIYQAIGKKTLDVASLSYLRIRLPSSRRTSACPLPDLGYRQSGPRSLVGQRDIAVLLRPTAPPHRSSQ